MVARIRCRISSVVLRPALNLQTGKRIATDWQTAGRMHAAIRLQTPRACLATGATPEKDSNAEAPRSSALLFFDKLDANKDGVIDSTEMPKDLFDKLDTNKDGTVDQREFTEGWKKFKHDIVLGCEVAYPVDQKDVGSEPIPPIPSLLERIQKVLPGLAASGVVFIAAIPCAEGLGQALLAAQGISGTSPISGIPVAIVLGVVARSASRASTLDLPAIAQPGANFACGTLLRTGTICIGAKLSALDLVNVGLTGLPIVAVSITVGMACIPKISSAFALPERMGQLIAVGTSICGVSAISAAAPVVRAERKEIAFAVANVVAFGTAGMLTAPYVAHSFCSHPEQVGIFLGLAAHDTAQVLGSALTYHTMYIDENALKVAVVTKLMRNLCLAAIVPVMAVSSSGKSLASLGFRDIKKLIPDFVLGFVALSALRTFGDITLEQSGYALYFLDATQWKAATSLVGDQLAPTLLGLAMAGLGLTLTPKAVQGVGIRPFAVGFLGAFTVACTGLVGALLLPKFVTLGPKITARVDQSHD